MDIPPAPVSFLGWFAGGGESVARIQLKETVADVTKRATVQHILVATETVNPGRFNATHACWCECLCNASAKQEALDIRKKIAKDGLESFGGYAAQYSTCGSAKKKVCICACSH